MEKRILVQGKQNDFYIYSNKAVTTVQKMWREYSVINLEKSMASYLDFLFWIMHPTYKLGSYSEQIIIRNDAYSSKIHQFILQNCYV